ncbi:MAG: 1-(5-phosphoribosyl)-5-[(5-phosphoribosylamino)methylideneamino]imidazole-4-carboxamide isomerase [Woeseiaceae bacterium]
MNLIPAIDLIEGQCVRLFKGQFDEQTLYARDPLSLAREYEATGFSDLHIVDLDGVRSGRQENEDVIRSIIDCTVLSTQIGGGIRDASQIERCFDAGAARVVIGSLAITQPGLVMDWLEKYGAEKIVLALDVTIDDDGAPQVATHGWTRSANMTLWQCLDRYLEAGLRHVLCTDIGRDGAMTGPNIELYKQLVEQYPQIHLQASGGIRGVGDLNALNSIGAPAAISGRALLDGKINFEEIATFLPAA